MRSRAGCCLPFPLVCEVSCRASMMTAYLGAMTVVIVVCYRPPLVDDSRHRPLFNPDRLGTPKEHIIERGKRSGDNDDERGGVFAHLAALSSLRGGADSVC